MAIIKCPECGHEVSDKAPVCPWCGVPIAGHVSNRQVMPAPGEDTATGRNVDNVNPEGGVEGGSGANGTGANSTMSASKNNKIILTIVIVVAIVVCGICYAFYRNAQSDQENCAYEYAMASKDAEVLQTYLDQYTDAPEVHRDSIQAHLDMLKMIDRDWTNTLVSGSKSAIEQYMAQHPDSPFKALALHKIDSIDWSMAQSANSVEAMELYIEQHPEGDHVEEANTVISGLNSKTLQPDEKMMVSSVMNGFLQSLNNRDEDALTSSVNPLLTNFLGKANATRNDVVTFMRKIYKADITLMNWHAVGDYSIAKKEVGDQQYEYTVSFSAMQSVTHSDNSTVDTKYKISAKINPEGRISEMNMVKIIE